MANERNWDSIGPVAFIADGGADGVVTIASVQGMRVKQQVIVSSLTKPYNTEKSDKLEIKKVLSTTKIIVGPVKTTGEFMSRTNLSTYLVADMANIKIIEQKKSKPTAADIISAVYEQEPVVAIRTFSVDEQGNNYSQENPFPIINVGGGGGDELPYTDDIKVIRDVEDDPIRYEFYLGLSLKYFITLTYNANKSAIDYKTTVIP